MVARTPSTVMNLREKTRRDRLARTAQTKTPQTHWVMRRSSNSPPPKSAHHYP